MKVGNLSPGLPGSSKKLEAGALENRGSRNRICLPSSYPPAQATDFKFQLFALKFQIHFGKCNSSVFRWETLQKGRQLVEDQTGHS